MKANEALKAILEKVNFQDDALSEKLDLLADQDLGEDFEEKLAGVKVMTLDAAKNNPELSEHFHKFYRGKIKGELFDRADKEINDAARALFKDEDLNKVIGEDKTQEKIKVFTEIAVKAINEKMDDPAKGRIKALTDELTKTKDDWAKEQSEWKTKENSLLSDFTDKLIHANVVSKIKGYELSKEFTKTQELQSLVEQSILEGMKNKASLKLTENGIVKPYSRENPELELYDGSKKVELDDLIQEAAKPFLKVSDPNPKPGGGTQLPPRDDDPPQEINPRIADRFRHAKQM